MVISTCLYYISLELLEKNGTHYHFRLRVAHRNREARQNPLALWHGGMGVLFTQGFGHYQSLGF